MEFVLFKKVCPCAYVWVDGFRYKNLMPVDGMGRRLPFFLGGVRFRASKFDDLLMFTQFLLQPLFPLYRSIKVRLSVLTE